MNNDFKQYFAGRLAQFKADGPESLRKELPELIRHTGDANASKAFLHFVADVCTELNDTCRAVDLLLLIEAKFSLSDAGWNNLAFCLWEQDRKEEALSAYQHALNLNPESASSLRGACYLAMETDRDNEAVDFCRRFVTAAPNDREGAIWFATALWNAGLQAELQEFITKREIKDGPDEELHQFIAGADL